MTAADIERVIREAFGPVPKPPQAALILHPCCECEELAANLSAFEAAAVPDEVFSRHVWDLPLLSDEGKHFYLQAWLLRGLHGGGGSAIDAVVFALDTDHRWNPEPPYTAEQWLAVDHWLAHVAAEDGTLAEDVDRVRGKLPK